MSTIFPVKYVNDAMRGAPQISGTPGTYLAALRAFLITGFGQVTALSVSVTSGVATAALQPGQSFEKNCVVLVAGATPAALNGEARVLTSSNSSITFATAAPDGVAAGSISIKVAPVGQWQELYPVTNKAVFRSTDPQASGFCLRVDDSGTTSARVRGFESMSDIDTGTGPFPTDAHISGGGYQPKSVAANAVAVRYDFAADSCAVLVAIGVGAASLAAYTSSSIRGFGDMVALRSSGDGYAVGLSCAGSGAVSAAQFMIGAFDRDESGADAIYMARSVSGLGSAAQVGARPYVGIKNAISGADGTLGAFPSSVDGELKYSRRYIHGGDGVTPRAEIPGVLYVPQTGVISQIAPRDVLSGTGSMEGRKLIALGLGAVGSTYIPTGVVLVDSTGPWR